MVLPSLLGSINTTNTSGQDAWAPSLPQITQFRMLRPSSLAPSLPQITQFRMLLPTIWAPSSLPIPQFRMLLLSIWAPSSLPIPQFMMLLPSLLGSVLAAKYFSSGCFYPHFLGSILAANNSVQDASALQLGSILTANNSIQDAALHLGSILTANTSVQDAALHLGSILTANTSVQDASALHLGSILFANTSVQDASAHHLRSILTAKYFSSGRFCPPSGFHPHCQYLSPRCFYPPFWAPSSLPNTSVQDASVLHLGSILTAKYLSSGCFYPHFWAPSSLPNTSVQDASALTYELHPHCRNHCCPLTYRWRVCIIWYDHKSLHLRCWIAANEEKSLLLYCQGYWVYF